MLKPYKLINKDIFKAHDLIVFLVDNVWYVANNGQCKSKLNSELKKLYGKYAWFKLHVDSIYEICKNLSVQEKNDFRNAFHTNNRIEDLCKRNITSISLNTLNPNLVNSIKLFFEELYTKFLGWKIVYSKYGTKKEYYDALVSHNEFIECPCCGFGEIKTQYSKGHSPYDHYLPQKHYPFSAINFYNLVPLCHSCNSDYKGEKDVLEGNKKIFYPFANDHPVIEIKIEVDKTKLTNLISKIEATGNLLNRDTIKVEFNIDDERIDSWDRIFEIRNRYFGKIADNRVAWITDVKKKYRLDKDRINNYTFNGAFDDVINADSDKHLGFLKSPYLRDLKSHSHLIKAMEEVSSHSKIS